MIKYRASFYDNKNKFLGEIEKFKSTDLTFKHGKGSYNVDLDAPYYERSNLVFHFIKTRYYFYNINNVNPMNFGKDRIILTPALYELGLTNDFFRQLNNLPKGDFGLWLKEHIGIVLIVLAGLGIAVYFLTKKNPPAQLFIPLIKSFMSLLW